jgi:two-component system nitrate/nitrite sensor histidine kinase NarX
MQRETKPPGDECRDRSTRPIPPATGWCPKRGVGLSASGLSLPSLGIAAVLVVLSATTVAALIPLPLPSGSLFAIMVVTIPLGALSLALLHLRIRRQLLEPLTHLRHWALRMQGGNLTARLPQPVTGEFSELAMDINRLSDNLQMLSQNFDRQVQCQTAQIAQKTRSLQILYGMAACINGSRDLNDLLKRFLPVLMELVSGRAAVVRLLRPNGYMEVVAGMGLDPRVLRREHFMPDDCGLCGEVLRLGETNCQEGLDPCRNALGMRLFGNEALEMVAVPLIHRGRTLGLYNLFLKQTGAPMRPEMKELLSSIGQHLGTAIEKTRLEEQTRELSVMQERNRIANELHDSLAQTLASLRFQVRVLDQTVQQSGDFQTIQELEQVENSLDEAYSDLRDLIAHCRASLDTPGLVPGIEKLILRFRKESGISVYLQNEWRNAQLPSNLEIQVARIAQEALTNIRKHAKAHNVRVLLRRDDDGNHQLLVEDDGIGFDSPVTEGGKPGEHLGLVIMRERAGHIGGELRIESEPGEGTRIELSFRYSPDPVIPPVVSRAAS